MESYLEMLLTTYELPIIFLGAFFFGEIIIINAAVLAGQGWWSVTTVFILAFLGTVLADIAWFSLGRKSYQVSTKVTNISEKRKKFLKGLEKKVGDRAFLLLLIIKFLYGTRIFFIVYLSIKRLNIWKFIVYDSIGTAIWLVVMVGGGWLAGIGIVNFLPVLDHIGIIFFIIIFIAIIIKYVSIWIEKKILGE